MESTDSETGNAMSVWCAQRAAALFTKKQLLKRLPILEWLPKYNGEKAVSDLIAGITVGLTVIPQAIAYADVANLPPQVCTTNNQ